MKEKVNIKEIARKLGVSASTVSRAVNDKPGVGTETRKKILKLIGEYNYSPDSSAAGLKTAKTRTIALITKKREKRLCAADYFQRTITHIETTLRNSGYHTITTAVDDTEMEDASGLLALRENRVDGFIIQGPAIKAKFILDIKNTDLPVVLLGNNLYQTEIDSIVCRDRKGAYEAVKHLIEHGHRKILLLTGPEEWYTSRERMSGYIDAVTESGLKKHIVFMDDTTIDTGKEYFREALKNKYSDITAVAAVNDSTAIGVIAAAREMGINVPGDIAVTGFDDIDWASVSYPSLTTVHSYLEEMAELAASRILNLLENPDLPPVSTYVAAKLVIRESCGCRNS